MPGKFNQMIRIAGVFLILLSFAGCKEKVDKPAPPEKPLMQTELPEPKEPLKQESPQPETMPAVTLTALKINEDYTNNLTWLDISASGTFLHNIVLKEHPERIIIVLHNTKKGKAPSKLTVNNGTITEIGIDELATGKGAAVRITVGLSRKTDYKVHASGEGLIMNIRRHEVSINN